MQNPLADWARRLFPTRPSLPRSIKLKAGDHVYLVLYDDRVLSRAEICNTEKRLRDQGIRSIFVGCDDPTRNMAYFVIDTPSPHAVYGETLSTTTP